MASSCSQQNDQVNVSRSFNHVCSDHFLVCSFTFANDMFVPVEDAHPLESLLVLDTQVCTICGSALPHSFFTRLIFADLSIFVYEFS